MRGRAVNLEGLRRARMPCKHRLSERPGDGHAIWTFGASMYAFCTRGRSCRWGMEPVDALGTFQRQRPAQGQPGASFAYQRLR